MAGWIVNEEVETAISYGFTVEQIAEESGVRIYHDWEDDQWEVLGRRDLRTFTKWFQLNCGTTFTYIDGQWFIRGRGLVEGEWVEVAKRDGTTTEKHVREIISDADGVQIASIY